MVAGPEEKENCMNTNEQSGGPESDCGEPSSGNVVEKGDRLQQRRDEPDGASRPGEPSQRKCRPREDRELEFRSVTTPIPPEILARRGELRHLLTQLLCRLQESKRRGERKAA